MFHSLAPHTERSLVYKIIIQGEYAVTFHDVGGQAGASILSPYGHRSKLESASGFCDL